MSHYYNKQGNPVYELPCSTKEGNRSVTIRDARKLNLQPGVTEVIAVLDKPGLLRYNFRQIVRAVYSEEWQREDETFDKYVDRLIIASKKEAIGASARGSELHQDLEDIYKCITTLDDYSKDKQAFLQPVINCITDNFKDEPEWISELSFSHPFGFGGKVDLSSHTHKIVLDFKSKLGSDASKFYKYNEHLMQLAAYRNGLGIPRAQCYDLYFSSTTPGVLELHEWKESELNKGWKMFKCLLKFWQINNDYDSSF